MTWHEAGQSFSWGINCSVFFGCTFGKTKFETRDREMGKIEGVFDCDAIYQATLSPVHRTATIGVHQESNGWDHSFLQTSILGKITYGQIRKYPIPLCSPLRKAACPRLNKKGGHIRQKKWRVGFKASTSVFYSETNPHRTVKLPPSIT